jgi:YVTN family beta-propeller protein
MFSPLRNASGLRLLRDLLVLGVLLILVPTLFSSSVMGLPFQPSNSLSSASSMTPHPLSKLINCVNGACPVMFNETGLATGTRWWVDVYAVALNTTSAKNSTGTSISFLESSNSGSYDYEIGAEAGYTVNPSGGTFTVNNTVLKFLITFTKIPASQYSVVFYESGLPWGTNWSVTFNKVLSSSSNEILSFSAPNGTYAFTVGTVSGYAVSPRSGNLTVSGSIAMQNVTFLKKGTYTATFAEKGLPPGASWNVMLASTSTGLNSTENSTGTTTTFSVLNGTYYFEAWAVGYVANASFGDILVNGSSVSTTINFTRQTGGPYPIKFTESGLPSGTSWSVTFDRELSSSTSANIAFSAANGTYMYTVVAVSGYTAIPSSGNLTVNGTGVTKAIQFTLIPPTKYPPGTYTVTFNELWLTNETNWSVTLGGVTLSGVTSSLVFSGIVNGTYQFSVGAAVGYLASPESGFILVNGSNANTTVVFTSIPVEQFLFTVTETGLPLGTLWNVTVAGGASAYTTGNTIAVTLTNGTHTYTVVSSNRSWGVEPAPNSVTVAGAPVSVKVEFVTVYAVTVKEENLPNGTIWFVNVSLFLGGGVIGDNATVTNALSYSGNRTTITFSLPDGAWTYAVSSSSGSWAASPPSGNFVVNGTSPSLIVVVFNQVSKSSSPTFLGLPQLEGYGLVAGIAVVAAVAGVAVFLHLRRGKRGGAVRTSPEPAKTEGNQPQAEPETKAPPPQEPSKSQTAMMRNRRVAVRVLPALFACSVMILTAFFVTSSPALYNVATPAGSVSNPQNLVSLSAYPLVAAPYQESGMGEVGATNLGLSVIPSMHVLVGLPYSNQGALDALLADLSNPLSPLYHHYLKAAQFDSEFSPSVSSYNLVLSYISSFDVSNLTTFTDRTLVAFYASSATIEEMFHTNVHEFRLGSQTYYAPTAPPQLPSPVASVVSTVEGLSSYETEDTLLSAVQGTAIPAALASDVAHPAGGSNVAGYLPPTTVKGHQLQFGPDLQATYDEQALFDQYGYPTNMVVATILWSGTYGKNGPGICASLRPGQHVGPFVPADVNYYFDEVLPGYEPHPQIYAVPIDGAPLPAETASCSSNVTTENTLDLEMVGSLAPGSSVYNVYGPTNASTYTPQAFSTILNPGAGIPSALADVSVISNSWGSGEYNDTIWYGDLKEAQARGITVLTGSGDGGGTNLSFPSEMAYNAFGDTSVGGTSITVNAAAPATNFLHITNNPAWSGSSGGISKIFPEPSWQLHSLANNVIKGAGRTMPDLGAIADNMLMTMSVNGYQYTASNVTTGGGYYTVAGTSISSPVEAGIVAEMDHVLGQNGQGPLGYLNPDLYRLADFEYSPCTGTSGAMYVECYESGPYNSQLPTVPLIDSTTGKGRWANQASTGYDLITGWGSIDAYNYTMYFLSTNPASTPGDLSGVQNTLYLGALNVNTPGNAYSATIEQNMYLANSLGAPVYRVKSVIYVASTTDGWQMYFTGWIVYPPLGSSVYEGTWTSNPIVQLPNTFDITTTLSQGRGLCDQYITFSFGPASEIQSFNMRVPGASYIIGNLWYNYSWQGSTIMNGPYPNNPNPGGLDPQFGLLGGPNGNGNFQSPTVGLVSSTLEQSGSSTWVAAATRTFSYDVDETGESSTNLAYTPAGQMGSWYILVTPGSTTQGVFSYYPAIGVGSEPYALAYDSGHGEIYVANSNDNTVSVISDATDTVVATISIANPHDPGAPSEPLGLAYDSGTGQIFVSDADSNTVSVICDHTAPFSFASRNICSGWRSDRTNEVATYINVGQRPEGIAYDSGTNEVFVANLLSDNVSVISDATYTVVANINVGGMPYGVAYDGYTGQVFVSNVLSGTVSVICDHTAYSYRAPYSCFGGFGRGWTDQVVATINMELGVAGIAYDSATHQVYVTNMETDAVSVISDYTDAVVATIPVGPDPNGIAYATGIGMIFVANGGSNSVSVIYDATNTVSYTVPVDLDPIAVIYDSGYDSGAGDVLVADCASNDVFVLSSDQAA